MIDGKLFFEDFEVGRQFPLGPRPVTAEEIAESLQIVHDPAPAMNGHANATVHKPLLATADA